MEKYKNYSNYVLLLFTAEWCSGCKVLKASLEHSKFDSLHTQFIDIDLDDSYLAGIYGVRSLPTGIVLKGGEEVLRFTGGKSVEALEQTLKNLT
jgi:thioredoxin 1